MPKLRIRTLREMLETYVPDIPRVSAAKITRTIMRLSTLTRPAVFHYDFDKRDMKGRRVLLLSQHAATDDPYYVNAGYPFVQPNAVMSLHNVAIPVMFHLMLADGVILKSLYEPDVKAMKHLMKLHRKGASFLIFPEGIQSMDGATQPLHPDTARLIKKLAMDTVLCTSHGAYLCNPRFDTYKRKGRLEYNYEMLFRKEELEKMSEEEIYARLLEKFRYNDFAWNSEKQYSYKGKVPCAHGLDNILFICPRCKKQFEMHVDGDRIVCSCGSSVSVDDRYILIPDDKSDFPFRRIDEWYRWEREVIEEEVTQDGYMLTEEVNHRTLNLDDLRKGRYLYAGEGRIELDREKLRYIGTRNAEEVDLEFDISRVPSAAITTSINANQLYYDGEYYQFEMKDKPSHAVKLMIAIEVLHDINDTARSKARIDALTE